MVKLVQVLAGIATVLTFIFVFFPQTRPIWINTNKYSSPSTAIDNHIAATANKTETVTKRAVPNKESRKKETEPKLVEQRPVGAKGTEERPEEKTARISAEEFGDKISGGICSIHIENRAKFYLLTRISELNTDKDVRNVLIPPVESYTIAGIPEGTYIMRYSLGDQWDRANKKLSSVNYQSLYNFSKNISLKAKDKNRLRDGKIVWYKDCDEYLAVTYGLAYKKISP